MTAQLPEHIDSTMMTCFRSCPEKFNLEFLHGLRPPGISIDLHAGGCFATALEHTKRGVFEKKMPFPDALARAHLIYTQEWGDFQIPDWKRTAKTFDRTWEAVEDYFAKYPVATDHVQPYFAADGKPTFEYTFAIPLEPACDPIDFEHRTSEGGWGKDYDIPDHFPLHPCGEPFLYTGRFDMLGEYAGRPVVQDEKTTGSSIGQNWADKWALRSQFLGYVWACQQAGYDLDTVVCRGISIQKTQIVHAEAILQYPPHLVARWHEQLRRDMWRLRRAWDEGFFDRNLGDACTQYGNCIFLPVCQAVDGTVWHSEYEVRRWNPLHANPIKEPTA